MNQIFAIPYQLILQSLIYLYSVLFQNFGLAIIALTILIRMLLLPLTLPATKKQKKMMDLKPKLDELKEKHRSDKKKLTEEQMKLYQEHGVNPLGGCLPQILQIVLLIILYHVFTSFLNPAKGVKPTLINGHTVNTIFLWLDLAKHDPYYILPLLAGASQFIMSKMMLSTKALTIKKNDSKEEKKEKEDFADIMQEVSGQMVFMAPIMTTVLSLNFASGLALYWIVGNICSIIQQYFVSGWGGLTELFAWNKKKQ
jgi:YidC/Oxa1 family membrane protein insertase